MGESLADVIIKKFKAFQEENQLLKEENEQLIDDYQDLGNENEKIISAFETLLFFYMDNFFEQKKQCEEQAKIIKDLRRK